MTAEKTFVTDGSGYYVQMPANNQWGFSIHSDDMEWPGGFGVFTNRKWWAIQPDQVPADDRAKLEWILGEDFTLAPWEH